MSSFSLKGDGHLMPELAASEVSFSQRMCVPVTEELCTAGLSVTLQGVGRGADHRAKWPQRFPSLLT